jgi:hypothetical protein
VTAPGRSTWWRAAAFGGALVLVAAVAGCTGHSASPAVARQAVSSAVSAAVSSPSSPAPASTVRRTRSPRPPPSSRPTTRPGRLTLIGAGIVLPDPKLTPGAVNPAVRQANIRSTICKSGYTATIRPPSSYTTALKIEQLDAGYNFHGDTSTADYEEDHLISLELGGSPTSPKNLWPEPYDAREGARVKDRIENKLHTLVCDGAISLRTARRAIATNWWRAYQHYLGVPASRPATHASTPPPTPRTHACTTTSSGSCIRGGEFCPQADYGMTGYDANGTTYVCTGDRTHPHWE